MWPKYDNGTEILSLRIAMPFLLISTLYDVLSGFLNYFNDHTYGYNDEGVITCQFDQYMQIKSIKQLCSDI